MDDIYLKTKANKLYHILYKFGAIIPTYRNKYSITSEPHYQKILYAQIPYKENDFVAMFILTSGSHSISITMSLFDKYSDDDTKIEETLLDVFMPSDIDFGNEMLKEMSDTFIEMVKDGKLYESSQFIDDTSLPNKSKEIYL